MWILLHWLSWIIRPSRNCYWLCVCVCMCVCLWWFVWMLHVHISSNRFYVCTSSYIHIITSQVSIDDDTASTSVYKNSHNHICIDVSNHMTRCFDGRFDNIKSNAKKSCTTLYTTHCDIQHILQCGTVRRICVSCSCSINKLKWNGK